MAQYKCYLLNRDNHILKREDIDVDALPRAVERGHALIDEAHGRFHGFEIWEGAERLHAFRREA